MKKIVIALAMLANAAAATASPAGEPECEGLKMATGPANKGYSKMFADMAKVCGNVVKICEVNTAGGLENLNAASTKEADILIAQVDTAATMKAGDENVASLQAVAGLNYNYLHVIVAANGFAKVGEAKWGGLVKGDKVVKSVQRFSDLRGLPVAAVGSAQLLVRQLDRSLKYNLNIVDVEKDQDAFNMVRAGKVAAALSVSGWPSGVISPLKTDSGLTMVPYDAPTPSRDYLVRPMNYKGLGVFNNNALAIPNVLFTRPFKGEKAVEVAKLKSCLASNLQNLQEGSYQPGWNEIKDLDRTGEWAKFVPPAGAAKKAVVARKK